MQSERDRANWDQVRERIDRGETGGRVPVSDPAAAPLGTDAEAGGASTAPEDIARSARAEQTGPTSTRRSSPRRVGRVAATLALAGVVAVVIVAFAIS